MKAYTDIEQSKKLLKILPTESADMGYLWNGTSFCEYPVSNQTIFKRIENIPCWSLATLLDLIPEYIKFNEHTWKFYLDHCGMYYMNVDTYDTNTFSSDIGILINDAYEIILKLKEKNLL